MNTYLFSAAAANGIICGMINIDDLIARYRLSPYQTWVVSRNAYKYNLERIRKLGNFVYAPYKCNIARDWRDAIEKLLRGPRADLIGTDRMIATDERCGIARAAMVCR
jgi:hypothetical protein